MLHALKIKILAGLAIGGSVFCLTASAADWTWQGFDLSLGYRLFLGNMYYMTDVFKVADSNAVTNQEYQVPATDDMDFHNLELKLEKQYPLGGRGWYVGFLAGCSVPLAGYSIEESAPAQTELRDSTVYYVKLISPWDFDNNYRIHLKQQIKLYSIPIACTFGFQSANKIVFSANLGVSLYSLDLTFEDERTYIQDSSPYRKGDIITRTSHYSYSFLGAGAVVSSMGLECKYPLNIGANFICDLTINLGYTGKYAFVTEFQDRIANSFNANPNNYPLVNFTTGPEIGGFTFGVGLGLRL